MTTLGKCMLCEHNPAEFMRMSVGYCSECKVKFIDGWLWPNTDPSRNVGVDNAKVLAFRDLLRHNPVTAIRRIDETLARWLANPD